MSSDIEKQLILQARKDRLMKKLSKDMKKNYKVVIEGDKVVIKQREKEENEDV